MVIRKFLMLLTMILTVLVLSSCSEKGSSQKNKPVVTLDTPLADIAALQEYNGVVKALSLMSISNAKALSVAFAKDDPLTFFLKLKEKDSSLQAEDMVRLLRSVEFEVQLKPLKISGKISVNALNSIALQHLSIFKLKAGALRQWKGVNASTVLQATEDEYLKQKLMIYNNTQASFGEPQLTLAEFRALKREVTKLAVLFNDFGRALQNVDTNSSSTTAPQRYLSASRASTFVKGSILNPVNENENRMDFEPQRYLEYAPHNYKACATVESHYPFQFMGERDHDSVLESVDVSRPLLGDEEGKRYFQINKEGLAEIVLKNRTDASAILTLEHNSISLLTVTLAANEVKKVYLPIFDFDVCVPYYITKDDDHVDATILRMIGAQKPEYILNPADGSYEAEALFTVDAEEDVFESAGYIEFEEKGVTEGATKEISFDNLGSDIYAWYIIKAPSGKLYNGNAHATGHIEVTAEDGTWSVYVIPEGHTPVPYAISDDKITEVSYLNALISAHEYSDYKVSMPVARRVNTKKFIISEMKQAEFSHDGETDGQSAEVTLDLHANMAPKLEFGNELDDEFTQNDAYLAYECWRTHGKNMELFEDGAFCHGNLDGMKDIFYAFNMVTVPAYAEDNYLLSQQSEEFKQNLFLWYADDLIQRLNDTRFKIVYELYKDLFESWQESVLQVNNMTFPYDYHYGIKDSIFITEIVHDGLSTHTTTTYHRFYHPVIETHIPILALPKERMAVSSLPFSFEFSASDADEVDSSAQLFSVAKLIVNQALAIITQNYAAMVCNTIDTMQELRQIEIDGEDDAIGEASFFLNRFSREDSFYSISGNKDLEFAISGFAEVPNHYTSYDRNLGYAALACDIAGVIKGGYALSNSVGTLLSGDYFDGLSLAAMREDTLSNFTEDPAMYTRVESAFDAIENGTAGSEVYETLASATKTSAFASGVDIFSSLADVTSDIGGLGGEGHNVMRSQGDYFFSSFDERKTRAKVTVKEVESLPIVDLEVSLTEIIIYDNYESGNAEIKLRTRVGVVSDQEPSYVGHFAQNAPFMVDGSLMYENGSNGYKTLPNLPFKGYLLRSKNYNGISNGDKLPFGSYLEMYKATYPSNNNMAAIYVEVGLYEGDGGGVDDDMIGVFTKTFYIEDIFNNAGDLHWERAGNRFRLYVEDYPVYDAFNLETSVELINTANRDKQLEHNDERVKHASARISFYIEMHLGEYVDYDVVDTNASLVDGDPTHGKPEADMSQINLKALDQILQNGSTKILDTHNNQVLVRDADGLHVVRITPENRLAWRTSITSENIPAAQADVFAKMRSVTAHFIDDDTLLIYKRNTSTTAYAPVHPVAKMVVVNIGENNASVSVLSSLDLSGTTTVMQVMRDSNESLSAAVLISDPANDRGKIEVYKTDLSASITKMYEYPLLHTPIDLLSVDDKTLLVKISKLHHKSYDHPTHPDGYWFKELQVMLLEVKDNSLSPTDIREFSFTPEDYPLYIYDGRATPYYGHGMRNINDGVTNRIVNISAFDNLSRTGTGVINLIYNSDTTNYRFGSKPEKLRGAYLLENPESIYYVDWKLSSYPRTTSKNNRKELNEKLFFDEELTLVPCGHATDKVFLDGRYLLTTLSAARSGSMTYGCNGADEEDYLILVDTLHIENSAPRITSDDFYKEYILENANSYHQVINFHIDDNESSVSEMDISFKILDPDTNSTVYEGKDSESNVLSDPANFWFDSRVECEENGDCMLNITYLYKGCISKKHNYEIIVKDREITVTKKFSIWQAPTLPDIKDTTKTSYRYDDRYSEITAQFYSSTSNINGCIATFTFESYPSWLTWTEYVELGTGHRSIRFEGAPPVDSTPGLLDITVHAVNTRGEDIAHLYVDILAPDLIPDSFSLDSFYDQTRDTMIKHSFVVTGIQAAVSISISGGEYSLDNLSWKSTVGEVTNNVRVYVRHTASSSYATDVVTTVTVAGKIATMLSRTEPDPAVDDTTPDSLAIQNDVRAPLASYVVTQFQVTGINRVTSISISNGEYSSDGGMTWKTTASTVDKGAMISVRHMSASTYLTQVDTTLTIGSVTGTFSSITKEDDDPNSFSFTSKVNAALTEMYSSSTVISGLANGVEATVALVGYGRGQEFKVNGAVQTVISNGDTLTLYHASSSEWGTTTFVTVQIGSVTATFSVSTSGEFVPNIVTPNPDMRADKNQLFTYRPQTVYNSPAVTSWRIENKPDWTSFDTVTGTLSGTPPQVGKVENIILTAINDDGTDSITFSITVENRAPYIDGGYGHTLDEAEMHFSFSDNVEWRAAVSAVTLDGATLISGSDYLLEAGVFTLYVNGTNNVPTQSGSWSINISATDFDSTSFYPYVESGMLDITTAQSTLVLENAPFSPGHRSKVKFRTVDRFDNNLSWASAVFSTEVINNNSTFIEPYKIKKVNAGYYDLLDNNITISSNASGWIEAYILTPACVDLNDGFILSLKRAGDNALIDTLTYDNTLAQCNDSDWNLRFNLPMMYDTKLIADEEGNLYVMGTTNADLDTQSNHGAKDVYLAKFDRNGVKRWEKLYGGQGNDTLVDVQMASDKKLYLSITAEDEFESGNTWYAGGTDWVILKVDSSTGTKAFVKQGGSSNDEVAMGITFGSNFTNLFVKDNSDNNVTMRRYTQAGDLYDVVHVANINLKFVTSNTVHEQWLYNGSNIEIYDENASYLRTINTISKPNLMVNGSGLYGLGSHIPYYHNDFYNDTTSDTNHQVLIDKRSEVGNYVWSHVYGGERDVRSSVYLAPLGNTLYVGHSDKYKVLQGTSLVTVTSMFVDIINSFSGVLEGTYHWETTASNKAIDIKAMAANASTHSLYMVSKVYSQAPYPGTNSYGGNDVISKKIVYDPLTDHRSGMERVKYYKTVNDYDHNLQWEDAWLAQDKWSYLSTYCSTVTRDGNNWRLPTVSELTTTIDTNNDPALHSVYVERNTDYAYVTSEEDDVDNIIGLYYWSGGGTDTFFKTEALLNARCVRTME